MNEPLICGVSIVIPVYKTPLNYFKTCLESLHHQTMSNCEFIIIFDGENNSLYTLCEAYKKKDSRFKLYSRPHFGVSATRNFGIIQSNGEYITFVDADDWIEKDCCDLSYKFAKQNDSDIVLFDYIPESKQYNEKNYSATSIALLDQDARETLQKESIQLTDEKNVAAVSTWCKLIKNTLIKENNLHFPENVSIVVDRPFVFSSFLFAKKVSYLHENLYHYNKIENSITYSFYNNKLPLVLGHLFEIKKISSKYSVIIANQAIAVFFSSWIECYFNNKNTDTLKQRVQNIIRIVNSQEFQELISDARPQNVPFTVKIETILLKRKITLQVWLHAIKWKISTFCK